VDGAGWQITWRYGHDWPLHCNHFIVYPAPLSNVSPQVVQHFKWSLLTTIWLQKMKFQETKHASTKTWVTLNVWAVFISFMSLCRDRSV
jgi:hypothetical protein